MELNDRKILFIGGLHRNGTSAVHRWLGGQLWAAKFTDTGVPIDEGQHLQTVIPATSDFGGVGRFAYAPRADLNHLRGAELVGHRGQLLDQWGEYWHIEDGTRVLVEKSPPNMIRMEYLQRVFPEAYFITMIRHPIVVSLASEKLASSRVGNH